MTNQQHPITPPLELVQQWWEATLPNHHISVKHQLCIQAARWGADQELDACVKWIEDCGYHPSVPEDLRAARRPKPPSLKEQALAVLDDCANCLDGAHENIIRHAIEQLPDAL